MRISEYVGSDVVVIEPHGRLTLETIQFFAHAIAKRLQSGWLRLIVDAQNIDYIDSAGLGALVAALTSCQRRGGRIVLVHVVGKNRELLRITKLLTVFDVYETMFDAERSFVRPQETAVM